MFTFSGLRSSLLLSFENQILRCTHLRALHTGPFCAASALLCVRVKPGSTEEIFCAASALLCVRVKPGSTEEIFCAASALLCVRVKPGSTEEIFLLLQCAAAGSRPCTSTSATTSNLYSHTLKKWSQSRALNI